jgi:hypothetical protein
MSGRASMPIWVVVAIVASIVALAVLWVAPAAGLVAGLLLLATGGPRWVSWSP